jgi:hypothetical protein
MTRTNLEFLRRAFWTSGDVVKQVCCPRVVREIVCQRSGVNRVEKSNDTRTHWARSWGVRLLCKMSSNSGIDNTSSAVHLFDIV